MRCPNCGYISFDYLKQCSKCQEDLTGERLRLNLPDFRPNPISIQEIRERAIRQTGDRDIRTGDQGTQISKAFKPPLSSGTSLKGETASGQGPKAPPPEKSVIEISMEDISLGPFKEKN